MEYNERIEERAQQSYPQLALLKQIRGVATLIAPTFLLTLDEQAPVDDLSRGPGASTFLRATIIATANVACAGWNLTSVRRRV